MTKDKVVRIIDFAKSKSKHPVASNDPLRQHLEALKEEQKKGSVPYTKFLEESNKNFVLKKASELFIKFKKDGISNEVAHAKTNDEVKSYAILKVVNEAMEIGKLFEKKELSDEDMLIFMKIVGIIGQTIKFIDRNSLNKYTHFLTDMDMLSKLDEETRNKYLNNKE
jgi:hypothetical protein